MLLLAEDWTLSGRTNAPIIRREIAAASSVFCLWNSALMLTPVSCIPPVRDPQFRCLQKFSTQAKR
ncbi:hypothetical protein ILYODFUR_033492, partial [Ilyodon furcidens]